MHNQNESQSNIDTILCKREQCLQFVKELKDTFVNEQSLLQNIGNLERGDVFNKCLEQIKKSKDYLIQKINNFYFKFEAKVKQQIKEIQESRPGQFNAINNKILMMIKEVTEMENQLNSNQYVKYILQVNKKIYKTIYQDNYQNNQNKQNKYNKQQRNTNQKNHLKINEFQDYNNNYQRSQNNEINSYSEQQQQQQYTNSQNYSPNKYDSSKQSQISI
ncbi:kelch motif family protein, putative [Ichthyophthirius multifiliis]|uniref:Kelch motif family protein, putative n=1 Tax=Ichthyophthirius multifiliis TaxID=5932 RepID=G0R2S7_ICHMU|nr:kelch motif family protein, putative [Ichthyophthirius multifiliis]EGR28199.1 kelch motif family protein, putative [Ichthyophthirius multifiliis]|eukprot:XP_004027544.1 kelch motif family protein, putative [Ichthyophthirius multifiliis]